MERRCMTDRQGHIIKPGDAVWIGSVYTSTWAIFAGDNSIIKVSKDDVVRKERITREPFGKLIVKSDPNLKDRLMVASAWLERKVKEEFEDFVAWVYTRKKHLKCVGIVTKKITITCDVLTSETDLHVQFVLPERRLKKKCRQLTEVDRGFKTSLRMTPYRRVESQTECENNIPETEDDQKLEEFPHEADKLHSKVVGRMFEALDRSSRKWYQVEVVEQRQEHVKLYWTSLGKLADEFVPLSELRPCDGRRMLSFNTIKRNSPLYFQNLKLKPRD